MQNETRGRLKSNLSFPEDLYLWALENGCAHPASISFHGYTMKAYPKYQACFEFDSLLKEDALYHKIWHFLITDEPCQGTMTLCVGVIYNENGENEFVFHPPHKVGECPFCEYDYAVSK